MANLSVRNLDNSIYKQLRIRSLKHHVSMEEEVRRIIAQAVCAPEKISDIFSACFGPEKGIDLKLEKHAPHYPLDFLE